VVDQLDPVVLAVEVQVLFTLRHHRRPLQLHQGHFTELAAAVEQFQQPPKEVMDIPDVSSSHILKAKS
jgi:hypothetical protein